MTRQRALFPAIAAALALAGPAVSQVDPLALVGAPASVAAPGAAPGASSRLDRPFPRDGLWEMRKRWAHKTDDKDARDPWHKPGRLCVNSARPYLTDFARATILDWKGDPTVTETGAVTPKGFTMRFMHPAVPEIPGGRMRVLLTASVAPDLVIIDDTSDWVDAEDRRVELIQNERVFRLIPPNGAAPLFSGFEFRYAGPCPAELKPGTGHYPDDRQIFDMEKLKTMKVW